jgi:hypothetical protein
MKRLILFAVFSFLLTSLSAQTNEFTEVDHFAASVGYYPPDTLAKILTTPYNTDLKKVRSIFYWITKHIAYDIEKAKGDRHVHFTYYTRQDSLKKVRDLIGQTVTDKKGICQDYADLFSLLCEYAKIKTVVVGGYARSYSDNAGTEKQEDHAWNAVMIDNKWHLLDATWASGYIKGNGLYTPKFNNYYFLTDPELMKLNHYPEDPKWLLTKKTFTLDEFFKLPTIFFDHAENKVRGFLPRNGVIDARIGSSLKFAFEVDDTTNNIDVVAYPYEQTHPNYRTSYADYAHPAGPAVAAASTTASSTGRHYIQVTNNIDDIYNEAHKQSVKATPKDEGYIAGKNRVIRNFQVNGPVEEIHVYYNDELMMKYNVNIIK